VYDYRSQGLVDPANSVQESNEENKGFEFPTETLRSDGSAGATGRFDG